MDFQRSVSLLLDSGPSPVLEVESGSGRVTVWGEDRPSVEVRALAHLQVDSAAAADAQARRIAQAVEQHNSTVIIRAPELPRPGLLFGRGPRVDYEVRAPCAATLNVSSRSGRVQVTGLEGALRVESRSGGVAVAKVEGRVAVTCRSGSVQAEAIAGPLNIEARSGRVRVRCCHSDVVISTRSGSVELSQVGGNVRVEARSGNITVTEVQGGLRITSGSGSVRYRGPVQGDFDISTSSGSVRLEVPADSHFLLDAASGSGWVRSELPVRSPGGRPAQGTAPTVRIRTSSGSILISRRG